MKKTIRLLSALTLLLMACCFTACQRDDGNNAPEDMVNSSENQQTGSNTASDNQIQDNNGSHSTSDNLVEDAGNAVDDAMDNVGNAVDDAMDGAGNAVDDVMDGAGNVVDDITGNEESHNENDRDNKDR